MGYTDSPWLVDVHYFFVSDVMHINELGRA